MPILNRLPEVTKCCGCVTDLKTAAAIIAVLGIVTSPAISWAVVRHAYVIRVSCFITTSATRPDVVDINLNNVLSFGFGANAGLGPSCLSNNTSTTDTVNLSDDDDQAKSPVYVNLVKYFGWIILIVDVIFMMTSVNFLVKIFKGADKRASKKFLTAGLVTVILSFVYGMVYVGACMYMGGAFPVFEFLFSVVDLIIWVTWVYFFWVIWSYYHGPPAFPRSCLARTYHFVAGLGSKIIGYYSFSYEMSFLIFSVGLLSNGSSFLQTKLIVMKAMNTYLGT